MAACFFLVSVGCTSGRLAGGWLGSLPLGDNQAARDAAIRKAAEADKQFPTAAQAGLKSADR